jgi:hypothetical protein
MSVISSVHYIFFAYGNLSFCSFDWKFREIVNIQIDVHENNMNIRMGINIDRCLGTVELYFWIVHHRTRQQVTNNVFKKLEIEWTEA